MLPVYLFALFWIVVAGVLIAIANRSAIRVPRLGRPRQMLSNGVIAFVYVGFAVVIPVVISIGNRDRNSAKIGTVALSQGERQGRQLFGEHCSVCHTLAAANAAGKVGPNLDILRPSESIILRTLAHGCLQKPVSSHSPQNCLGYGTMPANIVQGQQALDVASFVAKVAGQG